MFKENDSFEQVFCVSEKVYENFITLSGDRNPLHTDVEFAKKKGFQGKLMHGNILNGFLSYFIGECLPTKNVIIHSQTIEYKKPVYMGDMLDFKATAKSIHEAVNAIEFNFNFYNRNKEMVAKGKFQIGILV